MALTPPGPVGISAPIQFHTKDKKTMANTLQAKKRVRQTARKTAVNRARMSRVRSYVRNVEQAILGGDKEVATAALRAAEPQIMKAAKTPVLHSNTASRKVSRLAQRVAKM